MYTAQNEVAQSGLCLPAGPICLAAAPRCVLPHERTDRRAPHALPVVDKETARANGQAPASSYTPVLLPRPRCPVNLPNPLPGEPSIPTAW